jgi:16S rRNA processing protein RimM
VALAEIGAPIGLAGAVRIHTLKSVTGLAMEDSLLMDAPCCWIKLAAITASGGARAGTTEPSPKWVHAEIVACTPQTRGVKLQLEAIRDRSHAEQLRGALVGLSRASFPPEHEGETYWADLLGCEVVNRDGVSFGPVVSLQTNGEHDWLVVRDGMIPFVSRYIDRVAPQERRVVVDWQMEWFV